MSNHRANVIWQSKNGIWNIGFYDNYPLGSDGEDYDSEWDVQYTDKFHWVSSGHRSEKEAEDAWRGGNTGGYELLAYHKDSPDLVQEIEVYEDKAAQTYLAAKNGSDLSRHIRPYYKGPVRKRKIGFVARDLYEAKREAFRYKTQGYANKPDERIPAWEKEIESFDPTTASEDELAGLAKAQADHIEQLRYAVTQANEQRSRLSSWSSPAERANVAKAVEAAEAFQAEELAKLATKAEKPKPAKSSAVNSSTPVNAKETPAKSVSAKKYHISPTTGRPNLCSAKVRDCPFGGEADHYATKEQARAGYEKKMGSGLGKLKK
jgi:hypothetical protein